MKEKILEILRNNPSIVLNAEEITSMVFKFVEWCIKEVGINWEGEICVLDVDKDFDTVQGLFNYWLDNIYKK
jgi:hypothetical protein